MHIVMFLDGKEEVRISRLAGPTFCATSECSPMTTAPVQACPVLYCLRRGEKGYTDLSR